MKITVFLSHKNGDFRIKNIEEHRLHPDWVMMNLQRMLKSVQDENHGYRIVGFKVMFDEKDRNESDHSG